MSTAREGAVPIGDNVLGPNLMATVKIFNNGPIVIDGDFTIADQDGGEYGLAGRTSIGLCRCGLSANKPFCDGMHARQGFESQCQAVDLPEKKK